MDLILILLIIWTCDTIIKIIYIKKESFIITKKKAKIIVTLTTIPSRIKQKIILNTLNSLEKQRIKPDIIYINIPKISKKGEKYPITLLKKLIKPYKNVKLNIINTDYGPITKIIPILNKISKKDNIIIIDDDVYYHKNVIYTLLNSGKNVAGFVGQKNNKWLCGEYYNGPVDFLETYAGVLYKGYILKDLYKTYNKYKKKCYYQDDIVIGKHIKTTGYTPTIIKCDKISSHNAGNTTELRNINLKGTNLKCYNEIFI